MDDNELKFKYQQQRILDYIAQIKSQIESLISKYNSDTTGRFKDAYLQQIANKEKTLYLNESYIEFMRMPNENDMELRKKLLQEYPNEIRNIVPSLLPVAFHGTSNIGIVREIIKTHGLSNPIERGESFSSFASAIDVTSKSDIRVTCEFAESNYPWLPYGAIFAFLPKPEEYEKVNNMNGTEVFGGVDSVDFLKEPNRLLGIISTSENIDRIKEWCELYGLNKDRVVTHNGFIEVMKQLESLDLDKVPRPRFNNR